MSVTISEGQKALEALIPKLEADREFIPRIVPVRSNRASKMGHECARHLYYMRHDWDKATVKNWKGVGIRGNLIADWWKRHMGEKGYHMTLDQATLPEELFRKFQIAGKIDGRIGWGEGRGLLYEFKTVSEPGYSQLNTYDDFFASKKEWVRGYPAQLQIYLNAFNEDAGLFILCNPDTLEWKPIQVYRDEAYFEFLCQRALAINHANEKGEPLQRIAYGKTCQRCEFKDICLPGIVNEGFPLVDEPRLESILSERAQLKEASDRYKEIDKDAKEIAKFYKKDFIVGSSWKVEIKQRMRTEIDTKLIPIEERAKYEVTKPSLYVEFVPLSKAKF